MNSIRCWNMGPIIVTSQSNFNIIILLTLMESIVCYIQVQIGFRTIGNPNFIQIILYNRRVNFKTRLGIEVPILSNLMYGIRAEVEDITKRRANGRQSSQLVDVIIYYYCYIDISVRRGGWEKHHEWWTTNPMLWEDGLTQQGWLQKSKLVNYCTQFNNLS